MPTPQVGPRGVDDFWCRLVNASGWYQPDGKARRWTGPRATKTAASAAAPWSLPGFPELIGLIGLIGRIGRILSRPWEAESAEIGAGAAAGFAGAGKDRWRSLCERA
jgi:hypothetical protein